MERQRLFCFVGSKESQKKKIICSPHDRKETVDIDWIAKWQSKSYPTTEQKHRLKKKKKKNVNKHEKEMENVVLSRKTERTERK